MKIVTHNGQFHADEIFAIALLRQLFGDHIPVTRTRDIGQVMLQDPETWVLDVGNKYDPKLNNFDHHQNADLPATNILVLNHLLESDRVGKELFDRLLPFFEEISYIDTNGYKKRNGFQVNSLIKNFNSLYDGFVRALDVASSFVEAQMINVLMEDRSRKLFDASESICFMVRLSEEFPVYWKSYKECVFLISKDQNSDKWIINSIDGEQYPLIPTGKEDFIHSGKMVAGYYTKQDAIESGRMQCINTFG